MEGLGGGETQLTQGSALSGRDSSREHRALDEEEGSRGIGRLSEGRGRVEEGQGDVSSVRRVMGKMARGSGLGLEQTRARVTD